MEAPEVPLEDVQEHIQHHTAKHGHAPGERWTMGVALSTALFAALAAVAALIAGHQANEAMVAQIESSDTWAHYQAKSIKANILISKDELLSALDKPVPAKDAAKIAEYGADKDKLEKDARAAHAESTSCLHRHETMSFSVTMFQVAIALGAIAVLTRLRLFWMVSLLLGAIGVGFFGYSGVNLFTAHASQTESPAAEGH